MRLDGPYQYHVAVQQGAPVVTHDKGEGFLRPATLQGPKIYVFAQDNMPIYVGQTVQRMATRLRMGFTADGAHGYHGYRWRKEMSEAELLVWCLEDVGSGEASTALECIEAEIVFAYRARYDQWPRYQTEIHFHPSSLEHRLIAVQILGHFANGVPGEAKRKRLEAAGFMVGSAGDFLGLSPRESERVETRFVSGCNDGYQGPATESTESTERTA